MFQFTIYNLCMLNEPDFSNLENYPTKNLAQFKKKKNQIFYALIAFKNHG